MSSTQTALQLITRFTAHMKRINVFATAAAAAAAGLFAYTAAPPPAAPQETEAFVSELERTRSVPLDELRQAARGKILFTSSRIAEKKVVDELANYALLGVSMRAEKKSAYIRDQKLKRVLTKSPGEQLGSYEIIDIAPQGVTLRRGTEILLLSKG